MYRFLLILYLIVIYLQLYSGSSKFRRQQDTPIYALGKMNKLELGTQYSEEKIPVRAFVIDIKKVIQIVLGTTYTALLTEEGKIFMAGTIAQGTGDHQIAYNLFHEVRVFSRSNTEKHDLTAKSISGGAYHVVSHLHNNHSIGWGENSNSKLCQGEIPYIYFPDYIIKDKVKFVIAGNYHTAFSKTGTDLYICGSQAFYELHTKLHNKFPSTKGEIIQKVAFFKNGDGNTKVLILLEKGGLYQQEFKIGKVIENKNVILASDIYSIHDDILFRITSLHFHSYFYKFRDGSKYKFEITIDKDHKQMVFESQHFLSIYDNTTKKAVSFGSEKNCEFIKDSSCKYPYDSEKYNYLGYRYKYDGIEQYHAVRYDASNKKIWVKGSNFHGQLGINAKFDYFDTWESIPEHAFAHRTIVALQKTLCGYMALDSENSIYIWSCSKKPLHQVPIQPKENEKFSTLIRGLGGAAFLVVKNDQKFSYRLINPFIGTEIRLENLFENCKDIRCASHYCTYIDESSKLFIYKNKGYTKEKMKVLLSNSTYIKQSPKRLDDGDFTELILLTFESRGLESCTLKRLNETDCKKIPTKFKPYRIVQNTFSMIAMTKGGELYELIHNNNGDWKKLPMPVHEKINDIRMGYNNTVAVTSKGRVIAWGATIGTSKSTNASEYGIGDTPKVLSNLSDVSMAVVGSETLFFLTGITCNGTYTSDIEVCNRHGFCNQIDDCSCLPGYTGKFCEFDFKECNNICNNSLGDKICSATTRQCVCSDDKYKNDNTKYGKCICKDGYYNSDGDCKKISDLAIIISVVILIVIVICSLISLICCLCLCFRVKTRKTTKKFNDLTTKFAFELLEDEIVLDDKEDNAEIHLYKSNYIIPFEELSLIKIVGSGNSGAQVVLATWNGISVAVKKFRCSDRSLLQEFEEELTLLGSLHHPHIIRCYGACISMPNIALVTEFCPNGSISERLRDIDPNDESTLFSVEQKLTILYQICSGMIYLGNKNIIHRDMKSDNVLFDSHDNIKIIDLGVAKRKSNQGNLTQMVGTPYCMAPEIVLGKNYDFKCDVFSFSMIMFELFSENPDPFGEVVPSNINVQIATDEKVRPDLKQLKPNTPPSIPSLIARCWKASPSERPTFTELQEHFGKLIDEYEQGDDEDLVTF
mmetsp:Transcript_7003/g.10279  ORF Transcript_7003/g.10279 Transcript_7003/m.10279 type:complete len:1150 (-) Transcript_7003:1-3450(-)